MENMGDIVEALAAISSASETESGGPSTSAIDQPVTKSMLKEKISLRKLEILSKKDEEDEDHVYSIFDLTPDPKNKRNCIITFMSLLELHGEGIVKIRTNDQLFFSGVTINK